MIHIKKCIVLLMSVLALQACSGGELQSAWYRPIDAMGVLWTIFDLAESIEQQDLQTSLARMHPDIEHNGLGSGRHVVGHMGMTELFTEENTDDAGADEINARIAKLTFLAENVALVDVTLEWVNYRLDGKVWPVYAEHTAILLVRADDVWLVRATTAGGNDPDGA